MSDSYSQPGHEADNPREIDHDRAVFELALAMGYESAGPDAAPGQPVDAGAGVSDSTALSASGDVHEGQASHLEPDTDAPEAGNEHTAQHAVAEAVEHGAESVLHVVADVIEAAKGAAVAEAAGAAATGWHAGLAVGHVAEGQWEAAGDEFASMANAAIVTVSHGTLGQIEAAADIGAATVRVQGEAAPSAEDAVHGLARAAGGVLGDAAYYLTHPDAVPGSGGGAVSLNRPFDSNGNFDKYAGPNFNTEQGPTHVGPPMDPNFNAPDGAKHVGPTGNQDGGHHGVGASSVEVHSADQSAQGLGIQGGATPPDGGPPPTADAKPPDASPATPGSDLPSAPTATTGDTVFTDPDGTVIHSQSVDRAAGVNQSIDVPSSSNQSVDHGAAPNQSLAPSSSGQPAGIGSTGSPSGNPDSATNQSRDHGSGSNPSIDLPSSFNQQVGHGHTADQSVEPSIGATQSIPGASPVYYEVGQPETRGGTSTLLGVGADSPGSLPEYAGGGYEIALDITPDADRGIEIALGTAPDIGDPEEADQNGIVALNGEPGHVFETEVAHDFGVADGGTVSDSGVGVDGDGGGITDSGVGVDSDGVGISDSGIGVGSDSGGVTDSGVRVDSDGGGVRDDGFGVDTDSGTASDSGVGAHDGGGVTDTGIGVDGEGPAVSTSGMGVDSGGGALSDDGVGVGGEDGVGGDGDYEYGSYDGVGMLDAYGNAEHESTGGGIGSESDAWVAQDSGMGTSGGEGGVSGGGSGDSGDGGSGGSDGESGEGEGGGDGSDGGGAGDVSDGGGGGS